MRKLRYRKRNASAFLYDVVALAGVMRPTALGFKTDEIRRTITIGHD